MSNCNDYPTPDEAKRFKNNAGSVDEFVTSDSDTFVDQDGGEHITIQGIENNAETLFTEIDTAASIQRDQFNATFQAQFAYGKIGNISDYVGDTLLEVDKLNSYQYPDDSGEWYGPIQSQTFPITIPTDPSNDDGWALVNALTESTGDARYAAKNKILTTEIKSSENLANMFETGGHTVLGIGQAMFKRQASLDDPLKAGVDPEVIDREYVAYDADGKAFSLTTTYGATKRNIVATQVGAIPDAEFYNSTDGWWYKDQLFTELSTDNSDVFGVIKALSDGGDCWVDFGSGRYQVTRQTKFESIRSVFSGAGKESCKIVAPRADRWTAGDSLIEIGNNVNSDNITVRGMFFDAVFTEGVSGCSLNIRYNADFVHCQFKSGGYDSVNMIECAGLRVKKAKHTRLDHCNLNNNNCYSILFKDPAGGNTSLSDFTCDTCAFDESQAGIVVRGLVQELVLQECTFGGLGNGGATGDSPAANHQIFSDATINTFRAVSTTFGGGYLTDYGLRFNGSANQVVSITDCNFNQFLRYPIIDVSTDASEMKVTGCEFRNNGTDGASSDISDWTSDYLTCPYTTDVYILRADQGKKSFSGNTSDIANKFNIVADPTDSGLGNALWEFDATQNMAGGARIGTLEANGRVGVSKGGLYKINKLIASGFSGISTTTVPANSNIKLDVSVTGVEVTHRVEWSYANDWNDSLIVSVRPTSNGVVSVIVVNPTSSNISFTGGNLFYDVYDRANQ